MKTSKQVGIAALALSAAAWTLLQSAPARAAHGIQANFNDPTALSTAYGQARFNMAYPTAWGYINSSTELDGYSLCPSGAAWDANCWLYWQPEPYPAADYAAVRVEPYVYSHYHLGFEDPSIDPNGCATTNVPDKGQPNSYMGQGRWQNGIPNSTCIAADYIHEPRYAISHLAGEWFNVYIEAWNNSTGSLGGRYFDLTSFNNETGAPLDLWVWWYDYNWYELTDLGPGYVDVSDWAYDIWVAQIGSDTEQPKIDDIVIGQVYL